MACSGFVTPIANMADKIGPIQGVHPAANMMPTSIEPKYPVGFCFSSNLFSFISNRGWNIPIITSPITATRIPPSFCMSSRFSENNSPIKLADKPKEKKIIENPITKKMVWRMAHFCIIPRPSFKSFTEIPVI